MTELTKGGVFFENGKIVENPQISAEEAKKNTIAYGILTAHNTSGDDKKLKIKFDAMASHDITYVGIIQTARASGLEKFPLPYVLTNCHNSLCAVGGTINEDDHVFGLSAAKKYGGIYVPAHQAVIHSYMREMMSGCGRMLIGSDSHTRYGALGTLAIGEGGPELVKQLLSKTYDIAMPEVIAVNLKGKPKAGVGPQDVALALIGAVYKNNYVKNKVLEFVGDGIANLPIEFRNGIDVMTTETACLSSVWVTDEVTKAYFDCHGRPEAYKKLSPCGVAYYDGMVTIDLDKMESMIALPFHPSNVYTVKELCANPGDILREVEKTAAEQLEIPGLDYRLTDKITPDGKIRVEQGVIAGCAGGTFDNLCAAADILRGASIGSGEFALSAYPASQPVYTELIRNGAAADLMSAGVTLRTAFCGPCFGAGDVPANGGLSIRHSTRNFPNREGSKPSAGQIASVALMDARSIAATAAAGGILTPATELDVTYTTPEYHFDDSAYRARVYNGYGKPDAEASLKFGPNIADWPSMHELTEDVMLKVVSYITDPVTTTDELIPSGETSSYRSNPLKLAEFTLSRKDPAYLGRAKEVKALEDARIAGEVAEELKAAYAAVEDKLTTSPEQIGVGSCVFAMKPGDGSAREQAASCQRVLGGAANIAAEYATKRYRSNLINWGMLPFVTADYEKLTCGDWVFVPGARSMIAEKKPDAVGYIIREGKCVGELLLKTLDLTDDERQIILDGCLINYYKNAKQ
ncbi:MAG: hydratase [Clostridia bacterium]|nr:hydratase [Clostridia bacterium]